MRTIFVDFEMNPVDTVYEKEREICCYEIIEIGAVMLDDNNERISEYSTYIKPEYNKDVDSRIIRLTGITTDMVFNAVSFREGLDEFVKWCGDVSDIEAVYAWSDNDYRQLNNEMNLKKIEKSPDIAGLLDIWCDFQKIFSKQVGLDKPMSLQKAVEAVGREFEGKAHDALTDAINTAGLFVASKDDAETKKMIKLLNKTRKPADSLKTALGDMFDFDSMDLE